MNTLILMMFAVGAEPDAELERARAAVAVEIAKAQLSAHAPDDGVKSGHWELRRHWDGRVWHQTWVLKGEVKPVAARPFPVATTQGIRAHPAGAVSTSSPVAAPYRGVTRTLAPRGILGGTNCVSGFG